MKRFIMMVVLGLSLSVQVKAMEQNPAALPVVEVRAVVKTPAKVYESLTDLGISEVERTVCKYFFPEVTDNDAVVEVEITDTQDNVLTFKKNTQLQAFYDAPKEADRYFTTLIPVSVLKNHEQAINKKNGKFPITVSGITYNVAGFEDKLLGIYYKLNHKEPKVTTETPVISTGNKKIEEKQDKKQKQIKFLESFQAKITTSSEKENLPSQEKSTLKKFLTNKTFWFASACVLGLGGLWWFKQRLFNK